MGRLITPTFSAPGVLDRPEIDDRNGGGEVWVVIAFNNDYNTWDEVVNILMKATGCTKEEADIETWEIDNLGKSVVHHGDADECETVASVIRQIGMRVEVGSE
jgi:ATP-dependent Clp protease adapter protein ClpS